MCYWNVEVCKLFWVQWWIRWVGNVRWEQFTLVLPKMWSVCGRQYASIVVDKITDNLDELAEKPVELNTSWSKISGRLNISCVTESVLPKLIETKVRRICSSGRWSKSAFYDRIYQKSQGPINFKISTYLQDVVLVTCPNLVKVGQRSRSYGYIMYSGKMCYKLTPLRVVTWTSYSRANMRTTPNDCDTKCLLWKCRLPSNKVTAS